MQETFLDCFIRTTRDDELQKLVSSNMDEFKKVLTLYDKFKSNYRFPSNVEGLKLVCKEQALKTAKYFYHYTVYKNLPDRQVVVGQGSGVTDCDLTIMGENGEECPFTLLTAKLRKACNVESSTELFLDIDVVTKL